MDRDKNKSAIVRLPFTFQCASVWLIGIWIGIFSTNVFAFSNAQTTDYRIVSAGGSMTEILVALDLTDQIVGIDTSSSYPASISSLPKVGYYRQLGTEGVLSLKPSHLFAINGVGPDAVIQQLESVGVTTHIFHQERTLSGLYSLIESVGQKTRRSPLAADLINQIEADIQNLPRFNTNKHITFLMSANERGLMAAGSNTVPHLVMHLLNLNNPFQTMDGFKPISSEALIASETHVIFIPEHQTRGLSEKDLCKLPSLAKWASIRGCNVEIVDSLLFLGLTPRLAQAAKVMASRLQRQYAILP